MIKIFIVIGIAMCWALCKAASVADEEWEKLMQEVTLYQDYRTGVNVKMPGEGDTE